MWSEVKQGMTIIRVLYIEENQDGTTGGSHFCLLDLIKNIDKNKIDPYVIFYENNRLFDDFKNETINTFIYKRPRPIRLEKKINFRFFKKKYELLKIPNSLINIIITDIIPLIYFVYFLLKNKIQIIHLNNTVFAGILWVVAAKFVRIKVVVHERTILNYVPRINRFHHKWVDYILGMSKSSKLYLESSGVNTSKYSTFYDRIDVKKYQERITKTRELIRKELNINENQPVIGIVGNLQRWKGQLIVIEAVKILKSKHPKIKCLLIGDSSTTKHDDVFYFKEIKEKIKHWKLENSVVLTGHRSDIPDILNALDIFIHASLTPEPYGLVVLEAMAIGKAVIASNQGGPVEMIENGKSGILIEPGSPQVLAKQIDFLLADSQKMKLLGTEALNRVKSKFTVFDNKFIEDLYERLVR
ncbi:MAG: hypothetical protein CSA42_07630 [Gammaproteobacteria bacterium]|nr:MAG: hypothetical protein CSA42_07630 [Gammaproteobacteria bacterium]